ncbi:MAG: heme ABC exporter ATP-binding protein CcmA [Gaiellales bacterium]
MRSPEAVTCVGLVRRFGSREALAGIDLRVAGGEKVVVTGPNGAGKTTLLRVLATVLRPTAGDVSVGGHSLPRDASRARPMLGFAGHEPPAYPSLTGRENLDLYADLHGLPAARVGEALETVGLTARAGDRVSEFSRGMRQRLALARAVLHRPPLLLLDEPTAGLDDEGQSVLRRLLAEDGRTVIAATHEPGWFSPLATRSVRLDAGRLTG